MTKKNSYAGTEYFRGFYGQMVRSQRRSSEILKVAKQMAEKQHAENMQKLAEANMTSAAKKMVMTSLKSRCR